MNPRTLSLALLAPALLLVLCHQCWLLARRPDFQLFGELVSRVEVGQPLVALSFDDGPQPVYTEQILEELARADARASFFMVGRQVQAHPEIARTVLEAGHELGNHSWSHRRLLLIPPSTVRDEIERTDAALRVVGAQGPLLFRAPFGKKLVVLPWVLSRQERTHVLFDIIPDPPDYLRPDPQLIADDVLRRTQPGSIIVLHDGGGLRDETVVATRLILQGLAARGFRFVTVSELMEAGGGLSAAHRSGESGYQGDPPALLPPQVFRGPGRSWVRQGRRPRSWRTHGTDDGIDWRDPTAGGGRGSWPCRRSPDCGPRGGGAVSAAAGDGGGGGAPHAASRSLPGPAGALLPHPQQARALRHAPRAC